MNIEYTEREDGLLYPNLVMPEMPEEPLTKWGNLRMDYLEKHRQGLFAVMMAEGSLWEHCLTIQKQAQERMETMTTQMMKAEGVTEDLKRQDPMAWVGAMGNIQNRAQEVILTELIYS